MTKVQDFLKLNGLDYRVEKYQNTANGKLVNSYTTMKDGKQLGTVGIGYSVLQPEEQLEIMQQLAENLEYELEFGFSLKDDKQIMMCLRVPDIKIADDVLKSYICGLNSFDGSTSLSFTFSDTVLRCSNQFRKQLNNRQFSIKHSSNMKANIKEMVEKINNLNKIKTEHYSILDRFVSTPFTKDLAIKQIDNLLDVEFISSEDFNTNYSTRKKNIRDEIICCLERELDDLNTETMYSALNGITRYTTHNINPNSDIAIKYNNTMFNNLKLQLS